MKLCTQALLLACLASVSAGCGGPRRTTGGTALENVTAEDDRRDSAVRPTGWSSAGKTAPVRAALSLFDRDMNAVVAVDFAAFTKSRVYDEYQTLINNVLFAEDSNFKQMYELRGACGFHPLTEIKTVVAGGVAETDLNIADWLVVIHGLSRARFVQCSEAMAERYGGEIVERGEFTRVTNRRGYLSWVLWLDADTMAFRESVDDKAWRARLSARDDQRGHHDLLDILQKTEQDSVLWYAIRPTEGVTVPPGNPLLPTDIVYTAIYGWGQAADGLQLHAAVRIGSDEQARTFHEYLVEKLKEFQPMLDMIGLSQAGGGMQAHTEEADVWVSLRLSMSELRQIVRVMKDLN